MHNNHLGALHIFFKVAIAIYLAVYVIYIERSYLYVTVPEGNIRTTLQKELIPTMPSRHSYCEQYEPAPNTTFEVYPDPYPCLVWDNYTMRFPADLGNALFLTTRLTITANQTYQCANLPIDTPCPLPWYPKQGDGFSESFYVAAIENVTISIEHSMTSELYDEHHNPIYAGSSRVMRGKLVDVNDRTLQEFVPGNAGDVVTVSQVLKAGNVRLRNPSDAHDSANETMRYSGIVLLMNIEYSNLDDLNAYPTYTISINRFVNAESKVVEVLEEFDTIPPIVLPTNTSDPDAMNSTFTYGSGGMALRRKEWNRHGIKILFVQNGSVARFDWIALAIACASAYGLLRFASVVVEFYMLCACPERRHYSHLKYIDTERFHPRTGRLKKKYQMHRNSTLR